MKIKSLVVLFLATLLSFSAYATTKDSSDTVTPSYEVSVLKDGQPLFMQNVIFQDGNTMIMENTKEFACIKSVKVIGEDQIITPGTVKTGLILTLKQDPFNHMVQANVESATVNAQTTSGKCASVNKENLYREVSIGFHSAFKEDLGKLSGHDYTLIVKRNN